MKNGETKNCWEYMECGRELGGSKARELGGYPTAVLEKFSGVNSGVNGGRFCWFISGTLCKGYVQGTFAKRSKPESLSLFIYWWNGKRADIWF